MMLDEPQEATDNERWQGDGAAPQHAWKGRLGKAAFRHSEPLEASVNAAKAAATAPRGKWDDLLKRSEAAKADKHAQRHSVA